MQKSTSTLAILAALALALASGFLIGRKAPPVSDAAANKPGLPTTDKTGPSALHAAPLASTSSIPVHGTTRPVGANSAVKPPLPPTGAPLAQTYKELEARAAAGEADAASRLYHDVRRCAARRDYQKSLTMLLPSLHTEGANAKQLKNQEHLAQDLQQKLDFVKNTQAECDGVTDDELDSVVPNALQAAQLGDQLAASCYLGTSYTGMPQLIDHPGWLGDFKQNALQVADAGIQQGNWNVVELLQRAYQGIFSTPLSETTGADPAMRYRYLLLERLGAHGPFAERLDTNIKDAADELQPSQLSDADAWARDTYAQYFQDSGPSNAVSVGANICPAVAL